MNQVYSFPRIGEHDLDYQVWQEAEQSFLGAIFLDNKVLDETADMLEPEDFWVETHKLLWKGMKHLYQKNIPIDLVTITETLHRYGRLEEIGGLSYLEQLARSSPTAANAWHYAKIIKEYSTRKKGIELGEKVRELAIHHDFDDPLEYYDALDKIMTKYRPDATGKMKSFAETNGDYFEYLTTDNDTIKTGFKEFDDWSNGIGRGWLYILAGRPGIGKTAKALQMAFRMSMEQAGPILFWSQEMDTNKLKNRLISQASGINYARLIKKQLEPHELDRARKAHEQIEKFPLFIEDSSGITIEHVRSTARQMKRKHGQLGGIFVDYLTRMNIKQEKGETWSRAVGEVAKRSKWLAQEVNCPFIMLAQLSREGTSGEPQLHHLRDSGEIEQEADMVEFLWESEDKSPDGVVVESNIAKGRETGTKRFKYLFKGWVQTYEPYQG